jgi:hypothetical protein
VPGVPARHREDDALAGIAEAAHRRVDRRPRAARDEHGLDRIGEAQLARVGLRDPLAQPRQAVRLRVVRLAARDRRLQRLAQAVGDRELARAEVADRQVADGLAGGLAGAHLGRDPQDVGADQPARHRGDAQLGRTARADERAEIGCGSLGHETRSISQPAPPLARPDGPC